MKILIVGSGVVGGMLGARLVEKKYDVTFVVRPERKAQLLTTGLVLYSHFGKFRRPVAAITPDELLGTYDLILLTCRAQEYDVAFAMIAPSIGLDTTVLPLVEGANHLQAELFPHGGHFIGGMLEARMTINADGTLHQRLPAAELHIGATKPYEAERAAHVALLLEGRGIRTILSDRIMSTIWERYCFTAAAVSTNVTSGMSLRDAVRPTHNITWFDRLLSEGVAVGQAIGLRPCPERVLQYRNSYRMETRPVQPPALVADANRGSDEAAYLLLEMVAIADQDRVPVPRLRVARDTLIRQRNIEGTLTAAAYSTETA